MPTILFTWEHGGGLGHLMQMRPLAHALLAQGHRAAAALKDLSRARQTLGPRVSLLQAPFKHRRADHPIPLPCTFPQILHDLGYESAPVLSALVSAWRAIYDYPQPRIHPSPSLHP